MLTRARRSIAHEYTQQRLNDDVIKDAIADIPQCVGVEVVDLSAEESQHTPGSMDTINVNLWDSVFRGDGWRLQRPIVQSLGTEATQAAGTLPGVSTRAMFEMPPHLQGLYTDWSVARAGWAVLVPNRFLSESSFHTGYTPSWTHGTVTGEGVQVGTGRKMILVDLGWCDLERLMEEKDVRVARGPHERAIGSEGGHGHGWLNQEQCLAPTVVLAELGDGDLKLEELDATQNSTARTSFPQVRFGFREYMANRETIFSNEDKYGAEKGEGNAGIPGWVIDDLVQCDARCHCGNQFPSMQPTMDVLRALTP